MWKFKIEYGGVRLPVLIEGSVLTVTNIPDLRAVEEIIIKQARKFARNKGYSVTATKVEYVAEPMPDPAPPLAEVGQEMCAACKRLIPADYRDMIDTGVYCDECGQGDVDAAASDAAQHLADPLPAPKPAKKTKKPSKPTA